MAIGDGRGAPSPVAAGRGSPAETLGVSEELMSGEVWVGGTLCDATLFDSGLSLQSRDTRCRSLLPSVLGLCSRRPPSTVHVFLPAEELVAARTGEGAAGRPCVSVYHMTTCHRNVNDWSCSFVALECLNRAEADAWAAAIRDHVLAPERQPWRPRRVQVYVNPVGGRRNALEVWERKCRPLLDLAGVEHGVVVTKAQSHAQLHLETMALEDVEALDGVLVVGGDGFFLEAVTGLMNLRRRGADLDAAGARVRLGHVPAGSTDATAYSIYGSRSPETATLHCVLGDRSSIDVMKVTTEDAAGRVRQRYSIALLSCGFLGDVGHLSERFRFLGPRRYDLAGFLKFLQSRNYHVRVAFRQPRDRAGDHPCTTDCPECVPGPGDQPPRRAPGEARSSPPSAASSRGPDPAEGAGPASPPRAGAEPAWTLLGDSVPPTPRDGEGGAGAGVPAGSGAAPHFSMLERAAAAAGTPRAPPGKGRRWALPPDGGGAAPGDGGARAPGAAEREDQVRKRRGLLGALRRAVSGHADGGPRGGGGPAEEWAWEGRIKSVMVANLPCRSDKSKRGLLPTTHLRDGRMKLAVIRDVNFFVHMHYMARMAARGVVRSRPRFTLEQVTDVEVEALGEGGRAVSSWNVDGEVVVARRLRAQVLPGLVQVFGRGLDEGSRKVRTVLVDRAKPRHGLFERGFTYAPGGFLS